MTKVKLFSEYYFFEYQARRDMPQRFHYYGNATIYRCSPPIAQSSTQGIWVAEKTVFSSDFIACRVFSKKFLP